MPKWLTPGWEARRPADRRHLPFGMMRIVLAGERGVMSGHSSGMSGHTLLAGKAGLGEDRLSDRWTGTVPDTDEIARLDTGVPHIPRAPERGSPSARPVPAWCAVARKP